MADDNFLRQSSPPPSLSLPIPLARARHQSLNSPYSNSSASSTPLSSSPTLSVVTSISTASSSANSSDSITPRATHHQVSRRPANNPTIPFKSVRRVRTKALATPTPTDSTISSREALAFSAGRSDTLSTSIETAPKDHTVDLEDDNMAQPADSQHLPLQHEDSFAGPSNLHPSFSRATHRRGPEGLAQRPSQEAVWSAGQTTVVENEEWRTLPEVAMKIRNLPPNTTTLDLWSYFSPLGKVDEVEIFEKRHGKPGCTARLVFR